MLILNFSHPLTELQKSQVSAIFGGINVEVRDVKVHFDVEESFEIQARMLVANLVDDLPFFFVVNPPAMGVIAALIMEELRTVDGMRPVIRMKQTKEVIPTWIVAEVI